MADLPARADSDRHPGDGPASDRHPGDGPASDRHPGDVAGIAPGGGSTTSPDTYPGTPRWVKRSGIVLLVILLLVVGVLVAGGGLNHSMPAGGHLPSGFGVPRP